MKFILVSGGVMSGIGTGVVASSTGMLLKALGLNVTMIKIDPVRRARRARRAGARGSAAGIAVH